MGSVSSYLRQNVVGIAALFVALNAGAYAAITTNSDLATGSVDSRVIAQGGVTGPDIAAAAVGPHKIKLDRLVKYLQTRVNGACPAGQLVQSIASDGSVICAPAGSGTITGVTTSGGLTGAGTSGNVALGIDPSVIQNRIGGSCAGTEMLQSVNQNGSVGCQALPADGAGGTATLRSLGTGAAQAAAGDDPRLSDARAPTGAAGGELSGTYPNPSLAAGSVDTTNFAALPGGKMVLDAPGSPPGTCAPVTNGGFPALDFNALEYGNDVTFSDAADSLTVLTAGTYLVTAYVEWDANATGSRALGFSASGVPHGGGFDTRPGTGDTDTQGESTTQILDLPAGSTLTAGVSQTISGGGSLPLVDLGAYCASLAVQWLGP